MHDLETERDAIAAEHQALYFGYRSYTHMNRINCEGPLSAAG